MYTDAIFSGCDATKACYLLDLCIRFDMKTLALRLHVKIIMCCSGNVQFVIASVDACQH